jgi:hypothetical protein
VPCDSNVRLTLYAELPPDSLLSVAGAVLTPRCANYPGSGAKSAAAVRCFRYRAAGSHHTWGNDMTLSDLASIGSLVSGLAVLVSLVYLSLQVRQTDKNQRALMNQGVVTRNTDIVMFQSQPHVVALTSRVTAGETDFTAAELNLLQLRVRTTLLTGQDTYVQHQAGLVDEITLDNSNAVIRYVMSQPVYRALWRLSRGAYAPDWVKVVDGLIEDVPLAKVQDSVAAFRAELARVNA